MSNIKLKDHFSSQAGGYAKYRPVYARGLFKYLASIAPANELAWDSATGSGQAALGLAEYFDKVTATDASEKQILHAVRHEKIEYKTAPSEQTDIADNSVDLITVAQALHWFDFDAFFAESKRVLKDNGVIAAWSYNLLQISPETDVIVNRLYKEILEGCWPAERKMVEEGYKGIVFPFDKIAIPDFSMKASWTLAHVIGYLETWSAVQKYKKINGSDPVLLITAALSDAWGDPELKKEIEWPLAVKAGRL